MLPLNEAMARVSTLHGVALAFGLYRPLRMQGLRRQQTARCIAPCARGSVFGERQSAHVFERQLKLTVSHNDSRNDKVPHELIVHVLSSPLGCFVQTRSDDSSWLQVDFPFDCPSGFLLIAMAGQAETFAFNADIQQLMSLIINTCLRFSFLGAVRHGVKLCSAAGVAA